MKKVWKYLIGVFTALIVTAAIIVPVLLVEYGIIRPNPRGLVKHDPIIIWNDEDFLDYNFKGVGTQEEPYLIECFNITTTTSNAIYIFGTTDYFIIRNCFLKSSHSDGVGIYLENVGENTASIFSNTIVDCDTGLLISNTDKTQIIENYFEYCQYAISLTLADFTTIYKNNFYNPKESFFYHMFATDSYKLNISENNFDGTNSLINIDHCEESVFIRNYLINASFYILYSERCVITNNTGVEFNLLVFYSPYSNMTFNEGLNLSTFRSPNSRIEYNSFESYSVRELTIENYASYICNSNLAGLGLFALIVSSDFIDLGVSLTINSQIILVNCSNIWLIGAHSSIFDNLKIDIIFCSTIEVSHSNLDISFYFKDSNVITFYDTSQMVFYADDSNNLLLQNNTFTETDVYCSNIDDLEVINNSFIETEFSLIESWDAYINDNYFLNGEVDSYQNQNVTFSSNIFSQCRYGITDSNSVELFITNNQFLEAYDVGPRFILSEQIVFTNNTLTGEKCGFNLVAGMNLITGYYFENNTVNSNPLGFFKDEVNLVLDNQIFGQLIIVNCTNAQISNLRINNTSIGLFVYQSNYINFSNIQIENCYNGFTVENSPHSAFQKLSIYNCSNIGFEIESSSQIEIRDSIFFKNLLGVYLATADGSIFENNTCFENNDGLRIYVSNSIIVYNNTFRDNLNRGILLFGTNHNCNITYSLFQNNQGYAIEIYSLSYDNNIHHNAFINNNLGGSSQAMDRTGLNFWYDTLSLEGNFWNTWDGTGSYPVDYVERDVDDLYPLATNPLD